MDSLVGCVVGESRYTQGNDLEEDVVPAINPQLIQWPADGMHTTNDIPYQGTAACDGPAPLAPTPQDTLCFPRPTPCGNQSSVGCPCTEGRCAWVICCAFD
jgi:hypothetical protein